MLRIQPRDRLLFIGDSITHAFRVEDPNEPHEPYLMGAGYAGLLTATLQTDYPAHRLTFLNRGVCGNTTAGLLDRWDDDCLAHQPQVVSLLIGVNDANPNNSQTADQYESQYAQLLERTAQALPSVRMILLEPFAMTHDIVTEPWMQNVVDRQKIVADLAERFATAFVPLQNRFDQAIAAHPDREGRHYALDGIHPASAGHMLIARAWLDQAELDPLTA